MTRRERQMLADRMPPYDPELEKIVYIAGRDDPIHHGTRVKFRPASSNSA